MYKLLVYPYDLNESSIIRYRNMLKNYEIASLVCLEGAYENGKDAGVFDEVETGILITSDFGNAIEKCDVVLILDKNFDELKDTYFEKIKMAILKKRIVMVNKKIYDFCQARLDDMSNIKLLDNISDVELDYNMRIPKLSQPDIPVITVMSMGENCNKFEAQLDLRKKLEDKGYRVLQFGTKDYSEMFGFRKLPYFLMAKNISIDKKVYMFNYYVNREVLKEDYDVIILGVAGGILPINSYVTNYFGENSLIITSAINIDINMMCLYHNENLKVKDLYEIADFCKARMGCITDYFYMTNRQFKVSQAHEVEYFSLDRHRCNSCIPKISDRTMKFCHMLCEETKEVVFNLMLEELEDNIELV